MTPEERWAPFARQIHPSLIHGHHWLSLADAIDQADRHGVDVHTVLPVLAAQKPLDPGRAAADLKYRLLAATDFPLAQGRPSAPTNKTAPQRPRRTVR